jgi:hypothetical protein
MPIWVFLPILFLVWFLVVVDKLLWTTIVQIRNGVPADQRTGVSIVPELPLNPLLFWGVAALINRSFDPWGTRLVLAFHLIIGVVSIARIIRSRITLRTLESTSSST